MMPTWLRRLGGVFGKARRDRELTAEIDAHLQTHIDDNVRAGMSANDARRAALLALGGLAQTAEAYHERRTLPILETTMQDLRYALRMLLKTPGFTIAAVSTLALGIGANTMMFGVLNAYLFRPLPYPDSERLVQVFRTSKESQDWPHSVANFLSYRERNGVFEHVAAFLDLGYSLTQPGQPAEGVGGLAVTSDFFPALGVMPALGRVFTAEEDQPGQNLVVLSDRFWRRRFGADPAIVGRRIELDGVSMDIVGVMPAGFEHPMLWGPVDVWRPIAFTPAQRTNRGDNYLRAFGRLRPGIPLAQAGQAMAALAANLSKETSSNQNESIRLAPLQLSMSDRTGRRVMWFTFGLAGFVLLIACANLANLQLVRAAARAREHSIRAALGAGRVRLLTQSLIESLLVSCAGGVLSLAVAIMGVRFISARLLSDLPGAAFAVDFRVFGFALLCAVATGLAFGIAPAWLASRVDLNHTLKDTARGTTTGSRRLRHALVVGEVAFALILLTGAALFLRGIQRFSQRDPGWRVEGVLTGRLALAGPRYAAPPQRLAFYQQLESRLRSVPGVQDASISRSVPTRAFGSSGGVIVEGRPDPGPGQYPEMYLEPVSTGYFNTFGVRLIAGRTFAADDVFTRPAVVIVNETAARKFWPGESAVGKRLGRPGQNPNWMEVVGVVNDLRFPGSLGEPYTALQGFRPLAQQAVPFVAVALRTSIAPESLTDPLRRAVAEIDPTLVVSRILTVRRDVDQGLGSVSLLATLLGAFAALGLTLAAIGIYGVTAYTVTQRTNELGIRMALGAQARDILRLVMRQGAGVIAIGALVGAGGGYVVAQLLAATIPALPTRDPATSAVIGLVLVGSALAACYLPARRATKIDPLVALRND
jgi:predicted permease